MIFKYVIEKFWQRFKCYFIYHIEFNAIFWFISKFCLCAFLLRFHLTCLRQRGDKSIIWSRVHDARKVIQTSRAHDARRVIQTSKTHDTRRMIQASRTHNVRKVIQMNKIHDVHKMKSMSKAFHYCYKVTNDQKNSSFCYCVQLKLSI